MKRPSLSSIDTLPASSRLLIVSLFLLLQQPVSSQTTEQISSEVAYTLQWKDRPDAINTNPDERVRKNFSESLDYVYTTLVSNDSIQQKVMLDQARNIVLDMQIHEQAHPIDEIGVDRINQALGRATAPATGWQQVALFSLSRRDIAGDEFIAVSNGTSSLGTVYIFKISDAGYTLYETVSLPTGTKQLTQVKQLWYDFLRNNVIKKHYSHVYIRPSLAPDIYGAGSVAKYMGILDTTGTVVGTIDSKNVREKKDEIPFPLDENAYTLLSRPTIQDVVAAHSQQPIRLRDGREMTYHSYIDMLVARTDMPVMLQRSLSYGLPGQESFFDNTAVSSANAQGIFQLIPGTKASLERMYRSYLQARYGTSKINLQDIEVVADIVVRYFRERVQLIRDGSIHTEHVYPVPADEVQLSYASIPKWCKEGRCTTFEQESKRLLTYFKERYHIQDTEGDFETQCLLRHRNAGWGLMLRTMRKLEELSQDEAFVSDVQHILGYEKQGYIDPNERRQHMIDLCVAKRDDKGRMRTVGPDVRSYNSRIDTLGRNRKGP